ncbi:hypothetical protein IAQ61_001319 [Plenodomus lingam]|uniref:uncharacterized protein n=1 Tax=Leptosphaeria maculans TaxID=5022 RepID=UPI00332CAB67|nr:hypothetical protein IAQ61_001319 [Plenodomus lingam]
MVRRNKDRMPSQEDMEHPGGGYITVTAQQSRYALDAIDAPASKEILINDLSISVANRELLSRTTLHLVASRHYVLVGRNGVGKSTLLQAIANGLIPGIPWSTTILLLGQTEKDYGEDKRQIEAEAVGERDTVLRYVMRGHRAREQYTREERRLQEAFESSSDALAPARAYRQICHERLAVRLKEGHRIAERRSGARGKQARKELVQLEGRFGASVTQVRRHEADMDAKQISAETQAAADMLADAQASLELMDAGKAEAKARVVLLGLGFPAERIDGPISELSGGWKTRCELACALTQPADILLLDEPTHFLDLPSILWLQDYLRHLEETTLLVTTHDRDFGDAVAEELILLRHQKLETFRGGLSVYEAERWKKVKHMRKMKDAQEKQKKHMEKTIAGNIKAAKEKGDDRKLKQAASRKKKLDERMGLEVGLGGGRFKLNRDLGGYHTSKRAEIEVPDFDPPVSLSFPQQPPDLRFPGALVSLENVSFAYPGQDRCPVLKKIQLTVTAGGRIGIAGLNGSGKTTLVSLLLGSSEPGGREPTSGTVSRHARARIGRFSQQSVEQMRAVGRMDNQTTALQHVMALESTRAGCGGGMQEKEARELLGNLGLHGQTVSHVPLLLLSGGQKVRVALAKLLWPPPQLLILDEVTTHLDGDTIVSLVLALQQYEGALVVVTHDRFFMRCVVEGMSPYRRRLAPGAGGMDPRRGGEADDGADREETEAEEAEEETGTGTGVARGRGAVYRLAKGQLTRLERGMQQYEELAARAAGKATLSVVRSAPDRSPVTVEVGSRGQGGGVAGGSRCWWAQRAPPTTAAATTTITTDTAPATSTATAATTSASSSSSGSAPAANNNTDTPRSTTDSGLKAAKDKNCPFCGQAFTSSSLGRHLDLYIRQKNPKAPDGIHLVDEIRKLRGGITRRQAKNSMSSTPRRDDSGTSTPAHKKNVARDDSSMLVDSPDVDHDDQLDMGRARQQFRDIGWQSARTAATKTPDVRRDSSRQLQKADLVQRRKSEEEAEIARATEMALRELLKSVREANARVTGSCLFDFDPYSLNFPSLCLRILPAPTTLFSPTPFATAESWPISPPGQKQYEALNKQVRARLLAQQRQRQINQVYPSGSQSNASSAATSPLPTPPLFDPDPQKLFCHIADAYNHWTRQTDQVRQECWQIEVLRCYVRADDQRHEAEVQLENARREIEYLKANRWTAGAPDVPLISIHLGRDTAKELGKYGMDHRNWDYERLIEKWRSAIREKKASVAGMAAQKPLPNNQAATRSCSMTSLPQQHFATVNPPQQPSPVRMEGPFTAPPTINGDAGDQVDAEGDDDDDAIGLTPHTVSDENPMDQMQHQMQSHSSHQHLQLHMPQQSTSLRPPQQMQSHMQTPLNITQAMAQAQAWAAARQHMNTSRNQNFSPLQHQQMSPHIQHISSADNSRRPSLAMMDPHTISPNNGLGGGMTMSTGLEGMDNHQDQFLRMDMSMSNAFVGSNDGGVSMGG